MFPTLFISHGAPNIILGNSKSKTNIKKFARTLKKPEFIIIFSAHYVNNDLKIINPITKDLMYDFYGFEKELYEFEYEIKSDVKISEEIINIFKKNLINISIDKQRKSYDHGVWTTLAMMFDKLDIPIIQLSIPFSFSPKKLIKVGEILQKFKHKALVIGSGGITHNLSDISASTKIKDYAYDFNEYINNVLKSGDEEKLIDSLKHKDFSKNHPSVEHFSPLFISYGNAVNKKAISFNKEFIYSNISMDCFAFDI